jgi:hypothetical protein
MYTPLSTNPELDPNALLVEIGQYSAPLKASPILIQSLSHAKPWLIGGLKRSTVD